MTDQIVIDKIIDDFVDNKDLFQNMKNEISTIIKQNDNGNGFDLTYDEFCVRCLENIKNKDLKEISTAKTIKQLFLESIVQIAIDELLKRGRKKESEEIKKYLYE